MFKCFLLSAVLAQLAYHTRDMLYNPVNSSLIIYNFFAFLWI